MPRKKSAHKQESPAQANPRKSQPNSNPVGSGAKQYEEIFPLKLTPAQLESVIVSSRLQKKIVDRLNATGDNTDWSLGDHDGVLILEAPDDETATVVILHLGAMGNVHTSTCRAYSAAEMDKIVTKLHRN